MSQAQLGTAASCTEKPTRTSRKFPTYQQPPPCPGAQAAGRLYYEGTRQTRDGRRLPGKPRAVYRQADVSVRQPNNQQRRPGLQYDEMTAPQYQ